MVKQILGALGILFMAAPAALAQSSPGGGAQGSEVVAALFDQGRQLYEAECAMCHQGNGSGAPPDLPALSGNEKLGDLALIVGNIHQGRGAMPDFPHLTAEQVAALATYVRNSWGNSFGGAGVEEVTAILGGLGPAGERASVWDGVYTEAQAKRGQSVYTGSCAECHGRKLDGAPLDPDRSSTPPLARAKFLRDWDGKSIATLHTYMKSMMPPSAPGFLSDQEYLDIIAYMLATSKVPAGDAELVHGSTGLGDILVKMKP